MLLRSTRGIASKLKPCVATLHSKPYNNAPGMRGEVLKHQNDAAREFDVKLDSTWIPHGVPAWLRPKLFCLTTVCLAVPVDLLCDRIR